LVEMKLPAFFTAVTKGSSVIVTYFIVPLVIYLLKIRGSNFMTIQAFKADIGIVVKWE
jgi:hypothetical protein